MSVHDWVELLKGLGVPTILAGLAALVANAARRGVKKMNAKQDASSGQASRLQEQLNTANATIAAVLAEQKKGAGIHREPTAEAPRITAEQAPPLEPMNVPGPAATPPAPTVPPAPVLASTDTQALWTRLASG